MNGNPVTGPSVVLDEVHKMCVNKDVKTTIKRPTHASLHRPAKGTNVLEINSIIPQHKNLMNEILLYNETRGQMYTLQYSRTSGT